MTRDELILANMDWAADLAKPIYRRVKRRHPHARLGDEEDCIQIAQLALVKYANSDKYDPAKNDHFQGYAIKAVRGAVLMYFRALFRTPNWDKFHFDDPEWEERTKKRSTRDFTSAREQLVVELDEPVANPAQRQMQVAVGALPLLLRIVAYRHFLCSEPLWKLQEQLRVPKTHLQKARKEVIQRLKVALEG